MQIRIMSRSKQEDENPLLSLCRLDGTTDRSLFNVE